jgi:hypothetical protein
MSRENPRYAATPQGMRQFTEEEELDRDAEVKEWADGANDRLAATHRATRNELLASSDWTQMPDSPLTDEVKVSWATYRSSLRDLPTSEGWPSVTFPTEPS